jgi:hypothetical protein
MKIFSTFNDKLYEYSGKALLKSLETNMPGVEVIAYHELDNDIQGIKGVKVCDIPEFKAVFEANKEVITEHFGGTGVDIPGDKAWNIRWFGWFRKIAMAYHAICVEKYSEYLVFSDCDNRFLRPFDDDFLKRVTKGRPIGFFRGSRPVLEAGIIVVDNKNPNASIFYREFMNLFLTKEFRKLSRWDDCAVLEHTMTKFPKEWFCDLAEGKVATLHTNSNGYTTGGQIIAATEWGNYVEHDKGVHWKNKVVPHVKWVQ